MFLAAFIFLYKCGAKPKHRTYCKNLRTGLKHKEMFCAPTQIIHNYEHQKIKSFPVLTTNYIINIIHIYYKKHKCNTYFEFHISCKCKVPEKWDQSLKLHKLEITEELVTM
jgi:hypothetical protein